MEGCSHKQVQTDRIFRAGETEKLNNKTRHKICIKRAQEHNNGADASINTKRERFFFSYSLSLSISCLRHPSTPPPPSKTDAHPVPLTVQFTSGKYIFWHVKPHHASTPTSTKYNQASGSLVVKNVSAPRVHSLISLRLPAQILKCIIYGVQSRKVDFGRAVVLWWGFYSLTC